MRPPATSGAVATRTPTGFFHLTWPRFERDQLAIARDDGGDAAIAADAGRDLGADVGAPERAAARRLRARRTLPSLAASVTTLPLTAIVSGNRTAPMCSVPDRPHR